MDKLMKMFGSLLPKLAKKLVLSKKDAILTKMNAKMDLPLLDEKDERELLEGIWGAIEDALDEVSK
tara:strand:+ start:1838 stop:2035 length:198 start_codon:yes stop_codon:yes gene_type:complete